MLSNATLAKNPFSSILFFNFPNGNSFARVNNYSSTEVLSVCIVLLFNHLIRFTIDTPLTVETDESEYYKENGPSIWLHCVSFFSVNLLKVSFLSFLVHSLSFSLSSFRFGLKSILNIVIRIVKWFEVHKERKKASKTLLSSVSVGEGKSANRMDEGMLRASTPIDLIIRKTAQKKRDALQPLCSHRFFSARL